MGFLQFILRLELSLGSQMVGFVYFEVNLDF